jgi:hypothetical protein
VEWLRCSTPLLAAALPFHASRAEALGKEVFAHLSGDVVHGGALVHSLSATTGHAVGSLKALNPSFAEVDAIWPDAKSLAMFLQFRPTCMYLLLGEVAELVEGTPNQARFTSELASVDW